MIAFEVTVNGRRICTAGVGEVGVLSACLTWRGPQPYEKGGPPVAEDLRLDVGALESESREHLRWAGRKLKRGDVLSVRVVEVTSADKPRERERLDAAEDLSRQKKYVRRMARQFGWKLQT